MTLVAVRFPTRLDSLGLALPAHLSPLIVDDGDPAWAWSGSQPDVPIASFEVPEPQSSPDDWGVDHVVITVPDLDASAELLVSAGGDLRRFGETVRGQRAAFIIAGPLIEVIEVPGRPIHLAGLALETDRDLGEIAAAWRAVGLDPTDPHPAVQPGRSIISLRGERVAVMSRREGGEK